MMSNTGCTSVGDSLMTCSTSEVAVWRASASCVSLKSRAFWIAITAWSAKVDNSSICLSDKAPGCGDDIEITPIAAPSSISGAEAIERNVNFREYDEKDALASGAWMSATCQARPSSTARPTMVWRLIGSMSGPWNSSSVTS